MHLFWIFFSAIVIRSVTPATVPPLDVTKLPLVGSYDSLLAKCEAGGPDAFLSIQYESGRVKTYQYEECMKYKLPRDGLAQNMVFCKPAACYDYPNPDCTGGQVLPVKIPVLAGTIAPNAVSWYTLFGKSGTCQRSGL